MDAAQSAEARATAPVTAVRNQQTGDMGLLAECQETDIACVAYFPLGAVAAAHSTPNGPARSQYTWARPPRRLRSSLIATSPSVSAIPGTGSLDHLEEALAANDLGLSDEDRSDLRGQCVGVAGRPACHARFDLDDLLAGPHRHTTDHQKYKYRMTPVGGIRLGAARAVLMSEGGARVVRGRGRRASAAPAAGTRCRRDRRGRG